MTLLLVVLVLGATLLLFRYGRERYGSWTLACILRMHADCTVPTCTCPHHDRHLPRNVVPLHPHPSRPQAPRG